MMNYLKAKLTPSRTDSLRNYYLAFGSFNPNQVIDSAPVQAHLHDSALPYSGQHYYDCCYCTVYSFLHRQ